jgi:hypothetical protein
LVLLALVGAAAAASASGCLRFSATYRRG